MSEIKMLYIFISELRGPISKIWTAYAVTSTALLYQITLVVSSSCSKAVGGSRQDDFGNGNARNSEVARESERIQ